MLGAKAGDASFAVFCCSSADVVSYAAVEYAGSARYEINVVVVVVFHGSGGEKYKCRFLHYALRAPVGMTKMRGCAGKFRSLS